MSNPIIPIITSFIDKKYINTNLKDVADPIKIANYLEKAEYISYNINNPNDVLEIDDSYSNKLIIINFNNWVNITIGKIPENLDICISNPCILENNDINIIYTCIINLLKSLPSNTKSLDLYDLSRNENYRLFKPFNPYLPANLKKYITIREYNEKFITLPQSIEYLEVNLLNSGLKDKYDFHFLGHNLHTLNINNMNNHIDTPNLCNLPSGLKTLGIQNYSFNLATLPDGLEKLIIDNYYYTETDIQLPSNLKILSINNCRNDLIIQKYPPNLEHLDIFTSVDIAKLPKTLKSVGLYGFNLEDNILDIPENITTIYTSDEHIKYLPPQITKVLVSYSCFELGYDIKITIGNVLFRIGEKIKDDCFYLG
jgi:hypothetical protein